LVLDIRAARLALQFEQVMTYATERAWITGAEDNVMSALFVGVGEHDGEDECEDLGL
jgi:hypothetical protein